MSPPVLEQIAETCWSSPAPRLAPASLAETGRQTPVMECPETTTMNPLPSGGKSGLVTSVYEYLLGIWTCLICLTEDGNPLSSQSLAAIFSFVTARTTHNCVVICQLMLRLSVATFFNNTNPTNQE